MNETAPAQVQQLYLLVPSDDEAGEMLRDLTRGGKFTGERIREHDPERYDAIANALAQGLTYKQISKGLKVSRNTVKAIHEALEQQAQFQEAKKSAAARWGIVEKLAQDRLIDKLQSETLSNLSVKDLALAGAVARDKKQLLDGAPTTIVGTAPEKPSNDDFLKFTGQMPQLEVGAPPYGGETALQNGGPDDVQPNEPGEGPGAETNKRSESNER